MEPLVDTVIEDARWEGLGLAAVADRAAAVALADLGIAAEGLTLCVMGCDDARIAALNGQFRGKPAPTNVLSWPAEDLSPDEPGGIPHSPEAGDPDDPAHLGDVALAFDTCAREAAEAAKPMEDHVTHLIVHGILHLLGYDHEDDADASRMEGAETRILARLGLADPYS
jgi:probable rRNA maturation factor